MTTKAVYQHSLSLTQKDEELTELIKKKSGKGIIDIYRSGLEAEHNRIFREEKKKCPTQNT